MSEEDQKILFYLQDHFNIPLDIRMKIKDTIKYDTLCIKQKKNTTEGYKEVIKHLEYYIWLNKANNKKKHKDYTLLETVKHYDS